MVEPCIHQFDGWRDQGHIFTFQSFSDLSKSGTADLNRLFQHRLISSRKLCLTSVFLLFGVIYSFWIIGVLKSFCSTNRQVSRDYAVKRKGTHFYSTATFPVTVVPLLGFARGWVRWRKRERRKCKKVKPFLCLYSAKQWKYHFSFKWTWN